MFYRERNDHEFIPKVIAKHSGEPQRPLSEYIEITGENEFAHDYNDRGIPIPRFTGVMNDYLMEFLGKCTIHGFTQISLPILEATEEIPEKHVTVKNDDKSIRIYDHMKYVQPKLKCLSYLSIETFQIQGSQSMCV